MKKESRVIAVDKNFKFPRAYKYILAQITDPVQRNMWKKSYIEGTIAAEQQRRGKFIDIFSKPPRGEQ